MIAQLTGNVAWVGNDAVILDVHGIGFRVLCPGSTCIQLSSSIQQDVTLYTSLQVSSDDIRLFGFLNQQEQQLFDMLISVERVGPKVALSMLTTMPFPQVVHAIAIGNIAQLSAVPGLGKKTAERLVLELREKIIVFQTAEVAQELDLDLPNASSTHRDGAILALTSLGYGEREATAAVASALEAADGGGVTLQFVISSALRELGRIGAHHE